MSADPFAPLSRKKLLVYSGIAGAILLSGGATMLHLGTPLWRVLLAVVAFGALFCVVTAVTNWVTGGRRSDVPVGPAGVRPPVRLMRVLPYMLAAIVLFLLLQLLGVLTSK